MADEENSNKIGFKYKLIEQCRERLPIIEIKIITPYKEYPNEWLEASLDTGYDGGLLIPVEHYQKAELQTTELPVEDWDIAESITGSLTLLQASLAQIKIKSMKKLIELRVETFKGNNITLFGLNGIKTLFICLNGPKQALEISFKNMNSSRH